MSEGTDVDIRVLDEGEPPAGPRVVVGVDCSAGARAALLFAAQDAARRQVPLEVVSAYRPPDVYMDLYGAGPDVLGRLHTGALERARSFVAAALSDSPQVPPEIVLTVAMGTPADVLTRRAEGAELLVVGSRGRGGFSSMLLGSTSVQCALHAPCPVTVVHPESTRRERGHFHLPHRPGRREPEQPAGSQPGHAVG